MVGITQYQAVFRLLSYTPILSSLIEEASFNLLRAVCRYGFDLSGP